MPLNVEVRKIIKEGTIYNLAVVKLPDVPVECYALINREHDVLEMSTSMLEQATGMMEAMEAPTPSEVPTLPDVVN